MMSDVGAVMSLRNNHRLEVTGGKGKQINVFIHKPSYHEELETPTVIYHTSLMCLL